MISFFTLRRSTLKYSFFRYLISSINRAATSSGEEVLTFRLLGAVIIRLPSSAAAIRTDAFAGPIPSIPQSSSGLALLIWRIPD
jgi:hypothetical protein